MLSFSYTLSPLLQQEIASIESLRAKILLSPLSHRSELKLRFEALINRIYWSLSLSGIPLTKTEIQRIITTSFLHKKKKQATPEEKAVLRYKQALDYIVQYWYVNPQPLRLRDLLEIAELVQTKKLREEKIDLTVLLDYLQKSTDNPILQAAIAQMQIICLRPFVDGNGRIARLLALAYLYKFGYDFRGMLNLEEYWRRDVSALEVIKQTVLKTGSLNTWLEYFAQGLRSQLEKTAQNVISHSFQPEQKGFWDLTDRQRKIISLFDFPHATITNRKVQQYFKVSQITASRDLAKLATLGLIIPHGKGRSVYYTRG